MEPTTFVKGFHDEEAVKKMTYQPLGKTGLRVSKLGLGASALGGAYESFNEAEAVEVVVKAIRSGVNIIDTAPWYGQGKSETILGKALKKIPRQAYYLNTKVGRYETDVLEMFDFSREKTLQSVEKSLKLLGVDYIDIIQVHDMEFAPSLDIVVKETIPALVELKKKGLVRHIGITGYPLDNFKIVIQKLEAIGPSPVETVLSYCRYTLSDQALLDYLPFFQERGIGIINAAPLAMGLFSNLGPRPWHPAHQDIKQASQEAVAYCRARGVDISHLALKFSLSNPQLPTLLVSTTSFDILKKNLDTLHRPLSSEEKQITEDIIQKFFKPLKHQHWEGVEVRSYWEKLQNKVTKGQSFLRARL